MVIPIVTAILIAAADQIIKFFIHENLSPNGRVSVIDGLLSLVYSENRGAAFGIFQDGTIFFIIVTSALMGIFFYLLAAHKFSGKLFYAASTLILGGGLGNLIDRIFRGYVIDYLSVSFFPPICNFADYCITVGAFLFVVSILIAPEMKEKAENKTDLPDGENTDE